MAFQLVPKPRRPERLRLRLPAEAVPPWTGQKTWEGCVFFWGLLFSSTLQNCLIQDRPKYESNHLNDTQTDTKTKQLFS